MTRTSTLLVAIALALVVLPACAKDKAQAGCVRYLDSINATLERCGITADYTLRSRDGRTGCEVVDRYTRPDGETNIEESCIPWADAVSCEEFDIENLPDFCDGDNFTENVPR